MLDEEDLVYGKFVRKYLQFHLDNEHNVSTCYIVIVTIGEGMKSSHTSGIVKLLLCKRKWVCEREYEHNLRIALFPK